MLDSLTPPSATHIAPHLHEYFSQCPDQLGLVPSVDAIQLMLSTAFWASLRQEEGRTPRISLAYVARDGDTAMNFARPLQFTAENLARIAPAVERPGIHLAVSDEEGELRVWGVTRRIPSGSFVVEVIRPGLLVVKRRRGDAGKYTNVMVLESDELRLINSERAIDASAHQTVASLLGTEARFWSEETNISIRLATSMRMTGHGGTLLVVPPHSTTWKTSMVLPLMYEAVPPYREITTLMEDECEDISDELLRRERLQRAIDTVAGLTAVDGATVIDQEFRLLAFGAKIRRRREEAVENVLYLDLASDAAPIVVNASELGGTRHFSAAQFAYDQRDSVALVASQDGRFTVFAWSRTHELVSALRMEALLL